MRRVPWLMIVAVALVALLGALATLQYRWLGDVSQAERERMRAGLQTRASDFSEAFDRVTCFGVPRAVISPPRSPAPGPKSRR